MVELILAHLSGTNIIACEAGKVIFTVIDGDQEIVLAKVNTLGIAHCGCRNDDNYIVCYSRGNMLAPAPLTIEGAYSIRNKKLLNMNNTRLKVMLEYMYIVSNSYELANVLTEINNNDLGLLLDDEKDDLRTYLTSGNESISEEEVIKYILEKYPELSKYTNLKKRLSVAEYRELQQKIDDELGSTYFSFHPMSQDLEFIKDREIPSGRPRPEFKQIYLSDEEQQQRVLKKKR